MGPHHRMTIPALLLTMVVAVAGCGDDDGDGNDNGNANSNANGNSNQLQLDPIEPGGCGLPAYDWLPADGMGELIWWEEDQLSPISAAGVDVALGAFTPSLSPVPYGLRVYRIRYTTQDKGQPVEATGLVAVPFNDGEPPEELPMALWLHGTTGFTAPCAPSALGIEGTGFIYLFASGGYVTAGPDYIGLDGAADAPVPPDVTHFYVGLEQAGIGSLDSLRAAWQLVNEELDLPVTATRETVIWGASQGGHAAFATNLVAPYYAPEFDVRAMVAMVPPTDLLGLNAYSLGEFRLATRSIAAHLTTAHLWYEGDAPFSALLTDRDPTWFASSWPEDVLTDCDAMDVLRDATGVAGVFDASWMATALDDPDETWTPWGCYLADNSIATARIPLVYDTPTLFVLSENDDLVYTPVEREDFDRLCAMGYRMQYLECADASHEEGAIWSLAQQHAWLRERLAGIPLEASQVCQRTAPVTCDGQP